MICFSNEPTPQQCDISSTLETWSWAAVIRSATSRRFGDRYWSFHVKDVVADRSHDIELGKGNVDIRRFLSAIPELGRKPVYVEQEGATDSLASAKANYGFLVGLDL